MTQRKVTDAEATPAPGPSCAGCGVPMVLKRILRCPACGSTPELTATPSPATTNEREEFEKLAIHRRFSTAKGEHEEYLYAPTRLAWEGWQARAALGKESVAPSPAREETFEKWLDDTWGKTLVLNSTYAVNLREAFDAGAKSSQGPAREETPQELTLKFLVDRISETEWSADTWLYKGTAGKSLGWVPCDSEQEATAECARLQKIYTDAGARSGVVAPQKEKYMTATEFRYSLYSAGANLDSAQIDRLMEAYAKHVESACMVGPRTNKLRFAAKRLASDSIAHFPSTRIKMCDICHRNANEDDELTHLEDCSVLRMLRALDELAGVAALQPEIQADTLFGIYCDGKPTSIPGAGVYWVGWQRVADWINGRAGVAALPSTPKSSNGEKS